MNIYMISEGFDEYQSFMDSLDNLIGIYDYSINLLALDFLMDCERNIDEDDYVIVNSVTFLRYHNYLLKLNLKERLVVIMKSVDDGLLYQVDRMGCINSLFINDLCSDTLLKILLLPRTKGEWDSYRVVVGEDDIPKKDIAYGSEKVGLGHGNKNSDVKIIGIFSPMSTGKTTISAMLATAIAKKEDRVLLIDTDDKKKDLIYYFSIHDGDYTRVPSMIKSLQYSSDINIEEYVIECSNKLSLITDHRDVSYKMDKDIVMSIIENSDYRNIVLDISSSFDEDNLNEILKLCNYKILVIDKTLSTLNNIHKDLKLTRLNKYIDVIFNREVVKGPIPDKEALNIIKSDGSIKINKIFNVRDNLKDILIWQSKRRVAYGKSKELTDDIDIIYRYIYLNEKKRRGINIFGWGD